MASFNSIASGDWDDGPTTWGAGVGVYPGSVVSQTDSFFVKNGHTVSLNVSTFAGDIDQFVVEAGGKLTVDANFNTAAKFIGAADIDGELAFNTGAGTWTLLFDNATNSLDIRNGGLLTMNGAGAGCVQKLLKNPGADHRPFVVVQTGSEVQLTGRTKTGRTTIDGVLSGGEGDITFDDDTGWDAGDEVALCSSVASREYVELQTDNGGGNWDIVGTVSNAHADGSYAYNITKSVVVGSNSGSFDCSFDLNGDFITHTIQQVQFDKCDEVSIAGDGYLLEDCVASPLDTGEYGFIISGGGVVLNSCASVGRIGTAHGFQLHGSPLGGHELNDCFAGYNSRGFQANSGNRARFNGCIAAACTNGFYGPFASGIVNDCYSFGCLAGLLSTGPASFFTNMTLGKRPDGVVQENANRDIWADASGHVIAEGCDLNSTTEIEVQGDGYSVRSLNHGGVAGYVYELQQYGTIESNSVEQRSATYCDECDPSSVNLPLIHTIRFFVESGKTPSLKFWAKDAGTLGNLTVVLGETRCGLTDIAASSGSLDADKRFTTTGTYAEKTINFVGTTDGSGEVEVLIEILDSASGILYLDDLSVEGALDTDSDTGELDFAVASRYIVTAGGGGGGVQPVHQVAGEGVLVHG